MEGETEFLHGLCFKFCLNSCPRFLGDGPLAVSWNKALSYIISFCAVFYHSNRIKAEQLLVWKGDIIGGIIKNYTPSSKITTLPEIPKQNEHGAHTCNLSTQEDGVSIARAFGRWEKEKEAREEGFWRNIFNNKY